MTSFSDEQIRMLVRNLEMGAGLVMLGGRNSFGAGGWATYFNVPLGVTIIGVGLYVLFVPRQRPPEEQPSPEDVPPEQWLGAELGIGGFPFQRQSKSEDEK